MGERPCPICGQSMYDNPRYPRAICRRCIQRATDGDGRPVRVGNLEPCGTGIVVTYLDGTLMTEPERGYEGPTLYVDGIACATREAYLGGIELLRLP